MKKLNKLNRKNSLKIAIFASYLFVIIGFFSINANSTTISSKSDGNWSSSFSWNLGRIPTSTDDVIINNNVNVDVDGIIIASLTINSFKIFTLNLTNDITINGNVINNGMILLNNSSVNQTIFTVKGNFTNNSGATFSETGYNEKFVFAGSTAQTFTNNGTITSTMYDLTLNNSAGLTILSNIVVGGTLNMLAGNINLSTGSGYTLTLGTSTVNTGTLNYTSGNIITGSNGGFIRWFSATNVSNVIFPVGTTSNLNKIIFSFTTAPTSGGTLTARFVASNPGTTSTTPINDNGYIINTYSSTGYWQLDNSGITNGTYTIGLEGQGFNAGGSSIHNYQLLRFLKRLSSLNNWLVTGTHTNGTGSNNDPIVSRTGVTGFGQYAIGGNSTDNPFAGPLPVELTSFTSTISGRNVILNWSTSYEQNNSGFQIERINTGDNNSQWSSVAFVNGKNNSTSINKYSFNDEKLQAGKYQYRLKQVDFNGNYKYYELNNVIEIGLPSKTNLSQNYPNPFNPVTKIDYELSVDSKVSLKVYDITGKEIISLVNTQQTAGFYTVQFNANNLSSGVYFYRINTSSNGNENVITKKMNVIK